MAMERCVEDFLSGSLSKGRGREWQGQESEWGAEGQSEATNVKDS